MLCVQPSLYAFRHAMHENDLLLFELFAIFVAAKGIGEIFERLELPAVLGEILAGVLIGPYALGWIHPSDTLKAIAKIGAIFVLFHAGLEISPKDLIKVGRPAVLVAVAGIIAPFILGFAYMHWRGDVLTESVFVGVAMVATSVGITARVLGDLGVLSSRVAKIILGAAVFDDILGMLLLAVVGGLAQGGSVEWLKLGILAMEAILFALFMIFIGPRILSRLRPGLARLSTHNAPLIVALMVCLGLSFAASKIGMGAIIGAFFAGMIFSEFSPEWDLRPRVSAITEFLGPFFFFAIGSQLDVKLFNNDVLLVAIVVSLLAIVSKVVACGVPLMREGWKTALSVGVGMMPRGEVALIVAAVGLNSRVVSQSTYAVVVFMTAVTTVLAPPILRILFRKERLAVAESGGAS
ncbi:MAG TPA: cation:proton antiporter [Terriglobales bacterium]|nr:cation:proton antiporter [Terriglobales bacterium]